MRPPGPAAIAFPANRGRTTGQALSALWVRKSAAVQIAGHLCIARQRVPRVQARSAAICYRPGLVFSPAGRPTS